MNSNNKQPSPSHLAWEISSSDGNIPGPQFFSILAFIILFLLLLSQMSLRIFSFQVLQTCLHLWRLSRPRGLSRPTIIMMSLNIGSGNMSQAIINIIENVKMSQSTCINHFSLFISICVRCIKQVFF